MPAAIMARVPVLASLTELAAYTYLQGPAVVLRAEDETPIVAIQRLRQEKVNVHSSGATWDAYQASLYKHNRRVLASALSLM